MSVAEPLWSDVNLGHYDKKRDTKSERNASDAR
jgi:hypothetical protein